MSRISRTRWPGCGSSIPISCGWITTTAAEQQTVEGPARAEQQTPLEHFAAFYQLQNNQPLSEEQAAFCQQLIESIWKGEDDA